MNDMNIKDVQIRDVAIIGAGPVGLFGVFQCGMMGMSCHVIDALPEIGGQCNALYPEKPIYDIPAYPMIEAGDLIKNLEKQAEPFKSLYHLNQQVVSISNKDAIFYIHTSSENIIKARTIIVAAGAGAFVPNRPPLENIEKFEGVSVFYMVKNKQNYAGKNIVIAGGGDSAVDWAVALSDIAKKVTIIHRRDKFRALPESILKMQSLAKDGIINVMTPYQLSALEGNESLLTGIVIKDNQNQTRTIEADVLLPFYGLSTDLGPVKEWNLALEGAEIVTNPTTAETNQKGIYAIGDIAAYRDKKKFILTGFSEAAFAAQHIHHELYPDQAHHFEYSTTKGIPT